MAIRHDVDERTDRILHRSLGCVLIAYLAVAVWLAQVEGVDCCSLSSSFPVSTPEPDLDSLSESELESLLSELDPELSSFDGFGSFGF